MNSYELDPLSDARWRRLLDRHDSATVFHTPEWLSALNRTYRYRCVVHTTSPPGTELRNALVFCQVESWLTGKRLVSLPFSDHCAPLVDGLEELRSLLSGIKREWAGKKRRYVELRPAEPHLEPGLGFSESARYCLHKLDLQPSLDQLFRGMHASCVRRRVTRAMKEGFELREGRSEDLLQAFYQLAVLTRRRQHLPPQPIAWFRNLIHCLGDNLKIRLLFHSGRPAAGIMTLRFRHTMTYKYGFSDKEFHHLGSMQLLMWRAIEDAKNEGLLEFDMGRSEWSNEGLLTFKDRFGCKRFSIVYVRFPAGEATPNGETPGMRLLKPFLGIAPKRVLITAGNLVYRHIG